MTKKQIIAEMELIFTTLCDIDEYTESMAIKDFGKLLDKLQDTKEQV